MPFALLVHPAVPANSLQAFIALAKSEPGKRSFASAGVGTSNHLGGELLKSVTGIDLLHVPYKGSAPALVDLLAGRVDAMFDLLPTAVQNVKAGRARALAVTSGARSPLLPEVPTFAEAGLPQYDVTSWFGLYAPAGVPAAIVEHLNAETRKAVATPAFAGRLKASGAEPLDGSVAQFAAFTQAEYEKWIRLTRRAGIKVED